MINNGLVKGEEYVQVPAKRIKRRRGNTGYFTRYHIPETNLWIAVTDAAPDGSRVIKFSAGGQSIDITNKMSFRTGEPRGSNIYIQVRPLEEDE
jgi:hypothetical protein